MNQSEFEKSPLEDLEIRRLKIITVLSIICFLILLGRFFDTQVIKAASFREEADKQHLTTRELPAKRGRILARDYWYSADDEGRRDSIAILADNEKRFELWVVPRNIPDKKAVAERLAKFLPEIGQETIFEKINNDQLYIPPLKKDLTKDEAAGIEAAKIEGVLLIPSSKRVYPEGELAAQLIGFVDAEGTGRYGIEGFYDQELKGQPGRLVAKKSPEGQLLETGEIEASKDGVDVMLTVDRNVQYSIERLLKEAIERYKAKSGTIAVLNSKTGGVIGLASSPAFNPNSYSQLQKEQHGRFLNPAVSNVWEPGSIFKPIVVAAGLDEEAISPDSEGEFGAAVTINGFTIHNSVNRPYGRETVRQILENSDNIGMVWVANQIGNEKLEKVLRKFGFGQKLGVDIQSEAQGSLLEAKKWRDINRATIAFGQGVSVTPIQMLASYGAIANNGRLIRPHVVDQIIGPDGLAREVKPQILRQVISPKSAKELVEMLEYVVNFAYSRRAIVSGYRVAGKSGTAQVPLPGGSYSSDETVQSFIGFGPVNDPTFVVLVKLDQPSESRFAEYSAAPTFSKVMQYLFAYYQIAPDD